MDPTIAIYTTTVEAGETVAAGRFVTAKGKYPTPEGVAVLGVTRIAGASGDLLPVDVLGELSVEAAGTVAVGDALMATTAGKVKVQTAEKVICGMALSAGGNGDFVRLTLIQNGDAAVTG